jgi:hypothetical protein
MMRFTDSVPGLPSVLLGAAIAIAICGAASAQSDPTPGDAISDIAQDWFNLIDRMRQSEPSWLPPLITATPRLSNGLRYDEYDEWLPKDRTLTNFGNGKGLQAIVYDNTEIDLYLPPYEVRQGPGSGADASGWGDWPFFGVKYRFLTANEQQGDYVVSGIVQTIAPTGIQPLTNHAYMINPSIAAGKGWGPFDLQANVGEAFPLQEQSTIGNATTANLAAQLRVATYFWPEFEFNYSYWPNGAKEGKNQLFATPAIQVGRIPLYGRLALQLGVGYQYALTPMAPAYNRAWIFTTRLIW